jgi:sulfur-oxidizing protein SoxA
MKMIEPNKKRLIAALLSLVLLGSLNSAHAWQEAKSGYEFMTPESRAMQDDDFENPGMLTVEDGQTLFITAAKNEMTCGSCHGDDGSKLDIERITQYPVYSETLKKPITLRNQVHICWNERLQNPPMKKYNDPRAIALETFVRHQAHGEPVNVDIDGPLKPFYEVGKAFYNRRAGQLDMACTHCHSYFPGSKLRAQTLSQGHSNGFPTYRLANSKVNGLHERFRQCQHQFRAKALKAGSDEYVNLELYINAIGNGLEIETPAVRY